MRVIALIEAASVIERILRHLGLPTAVPSPHPGRAPPLLISAPCVANTATSVFLPSPPIRRTATDSAEVCARLPSGSPAFGAFPLKRRRDQP